MTESRSWNGATAKREIYESLRRPRRCGGFRTSFFGRCPDFVERDRLRRRQRHPVLRMAINSLLVVAPARDAVPFA
jgi:hypothetical protein